MRFSEKNWWICKCVKIEIFRKSNSFKIIIKMTENKGRIERWILKIKRISLKRLKEMFLLKLV